MGAGSNSEADERIATGKGRARIAGHARNRLQDQGERAAREGRNRRTGERIAIGPSASVSFKAGKVLKDVLKRYAGSLAYPAKRQLPAPGEAGSL